MLNRGFSLEPPETPSRKNATGWLLLALSSLVIGGLFTLLIVMSRTPGIQDIFPWVDFFHTALVVHVDLTVLVWFLSFAGVLWSLNGSGRHTPWMRAALWLCVAGTLTITAAPFLGAGNPLMNNYVPVLQDPVFFFGLGLFGAGFTALVLHGLLFSRPVGKQITGTGALRFGMLTALAIALLAILALAASWSGMPDSVTGKSYYELLFWGAGHTIQFTHVQLMLVVWLWLATISGALPNLSPRVALLLFALGALPALLTPGIYLAYEVGSANHILGLTWLMQYGGGLAALPMGAIIVWTALQSGKPPETCRAERTALLFSILLFGVGGIIGFLISGSNVTIPAHYHGSIVAVTLAYMGITYHILPWLGFRKPLGRIVALQPAIYGSGQLMHVLGLAWSGGYGVQRKTAGSAQGLESIQKIAGMGIMGLGGLIAIVGGILFLVIVFRAMWPRGQQQEQ
ncbi:MAG TPA: cytochrome C oxidase subunit I [Gammaproteobacteria bacterium]|nr:cytochrome C oxidase subunit I [Gammaproteobacteria bacterium]